MANDAKPSTPREGRLRWLLGWVVLPLTLIAALFFAGVHVGARNPDMGLARALLKLFGAEAGVAARLSSLAFDPRPGAKPGAPFHYSVMLRPNEMRAIADKSLGSSVDELDCVHVCRAYVRSEHQAEVFSIDHCKLARSIRAAPVQMACEGKLEALEAVKPDAKPTNDPVAKPTNDPAAKPTE